MYAHAALTQRIIGLAIEVHRELGPGLLESVYKACLCHELRRAGFGFAAEVPMPIRYKDTTIELGFRADIVVERAVIVEAKAVGSLAAGHEARVLTYLRASGLSVGLPMNFQAARLKDGLRRFVA